MAHQFYLWSQTAASNATADPAVNFSEGQAPSSVNDSARAMMASTAAFRDDISGAIVTAGTSTAYTVTSFQIFDSLAHMNGAMIAFTPHATNTGTTTLNVDGLGGKPLRGQPSVELPSGSLILGTPYVATYNNSDAAWYLQGGVSNPYNVPLLSGMDYWDTVAPNSSFIFPLGQAISRTTYASAFARWGTTYGVGDGSTTFNAPDKGGRVSAMKEASASRLTVAGSGIDGGTIGSAGGTEVITMARANMPNVTLAVTGTVVAVSGTTVVQGGTYSNNTTLQTGATGFGVNAGGTGTSATLTSSSANGGGSVSLTAASINGAVTQTAMNNAPPLIVCNYIIRVL